MFRNNPGCNCCCGCDDCSSCPTLRVVIPAPDDADCSDCANLAGTFDCEYAGTDGSGICYWTYEDTVTICSGTHDRCIVVVAELVSGSYQYGVGMIISDVAVGEDALSSTTFHQGLLACDSSIFAKRLFRGALGENSSSSTGTLSECATLGSSWAEETTISIDSADVAMEHSFGSRLCEWLAGDGHEVTITAV